MTSRPPLGVVTQIMLLAMSTAPASNDRALGQLSRLGALVAAFDDVQPGAHLGGVMDHIDTFDLGRAGAERAAWAALGALNPLEESPWFTARPEALASIVDEVDQLWFDV